MRGADALPAASVARTALRAWPPVFRDLPAFAAWRFADVDYPGIAVRFA